LSASKSFDDVAIIGYPDLNYKINKGAIGGSFLFAFKKLSPQLLLLQRLTANQQSAFAI
jgi:hypothetical protein